jgi:hypothetical protein
MRRAAISPRLAIRSRRIGRGRVMIFEDFGFQIGGFFGRLMLAIGPRNVCCL